MEKYRILLVEDDPRQIKWAQECLKDHELTIAESEEEFIKKFFDTNSIFGNNKPRPDFCFDFTIIDLHLPVKKGETPSPQIGKGIYETIIRKCIINPSYRLSKIKGCALVSNYEHHCVNEEEELQMQVVDLPYFFLFDKYNYHNNEKINNFVFPVGDIEEEPNRILQIVDFNGRKYTHFLTKEGEVITEYEAQSRFNYDRCAGWYNAVLKEGCIFLKSYDRVLKYLEEGYNKYKTKII